MHEDLAVFATLGRLISFCFDYETRPETKRNIEIAISRTGSLLQQQGARVSVVSLPGPEKGVDDLIVTHSPLAYEQLAIAALPLQQWREHNKQERHLAIVPPQKLTIAQREERLKESSLGQQPSNYKNSNQSPEQTSHDNIEQQLDQEVTAGGRHSFINGDRQPDTERRGVESSERRNLTVKQGVTEGYTQAVERQSLDDEANAQQFHRSVQGSLRETKIGQNERNAEGFSRSDEQSLGQTGGYEPGTSSGQRTGDGSLRGNYGQQETTSGQQTEVVTPKSDEQWTAALVDLALSVQSVNDERLIIDAGLNRQLASLTRQINNLNLLSGQYEFTGLSELAEAHFQQQSEDNLVKELKQIVVVLSGITQGLTPTDELPQEIVIDWTMAESRTEASALISELRPEISLFCHFPN